MDTSLVQTRIKSILKGMVKATEHKKSLGYKATLPDGYHELLSLYNDLTQKTLF